MDNVVAALIRSQLPMCALEKMALSNQAGMYGGIYNGSALPANAAWDTYNYCNAPHVNAAHYTLPSQAQHAASHGHKSAHAQLVYVINIQRHAKRTPDNLVPNGGEGMFNPPGGWDCSEFNVFDYISGGATVSTRTSIPAWNPFLANIWNGSCANGQLTPAGFRDAVQHGKDFWSVYGPGGPAALLEEVSKDTVKFRASPSPRTAHVSSGLLRGMGYSQSSPFEVETHPDPIDGIVPSYSCAYASELRAQIEEEDEWKDQLKSKQHLFDDINAVLGTGEESAWNSWIDHAFDFLASRSCHGHPLPRNTTSGRSINAQQARQVYAEGDWEYNYIWNRSPRADEYVKYSTAVLAKELTLNLRAVLDEKQGDEKVRFIIGHDGTMVRLLKTLAQSDTIRWPALGSEVVFEIWRSGQENETAQHHVRILSYGDTLYSTAKSLTGRADNQAAPVSWVPLSSLIKYLEGRIPSDLVSRCRSQ